MLSVKFLDYRTCPTCYVLATVENREPKDTAHYIYDTRNKTVRYIFCEECKVMRIQRNRGHNKGWI